MQRCISSIRPVNRTLTDALESCFSKHHSKLQNFYKTDSSEELWQRLSLCDASVFHYNQEVLESRRKLFAHQRKIHSQAYYNFIRELYPLRRQSDIELSAGDSVINWFTNSIKYSRVDHTQLFEAYTKLNNPFQDLSFEEYADFIERFLYQYSSFQRPNKLSSSTIVGRADALIRSDFDDMLAKRREYVSQISRILSDLKRQGLELTVDEQNALVFALFYRDNSEILDRVKQIPRTDVDNKYPRFNAIICEQIQKSMVDRLGYVPVDTQNVLLFHAVRHGQDDIIDSIIQDLRVFEEDSYANDRTFAILIEHFSNRKDVLESLTEAIVRGRSLCLQGTKTERGPAVSYLTINSVNALMAALCAVNSDLARQLFINLFVSEKFEKTDQITSEIYKRIGHEHRRTYDNMVMICENIARITGAPMEAFRVDPTEQTFNIIFKVTAQNPHDSLALLDSMIHRYGLPPSTRIFRRLFQQHWDLKNIIELTERLVNFHDNNVHITPDNTSVRASKQIEHLMSKLKPGMRLDIPQQSWIKLTDALMEDIFVSYLSALQHAGVESKVIDRVNQHRQDLHSRLKALRVGYTGGVKDVHILDEINYAKKAYLMDLVYECGIVIE